ncbi:putative transcription factor SPT20 homolog-like 2 [Schistocerca americana]|uniref:putative transcription factor SPT20 homolog-like 2 n=1 Tax=Schistocerca americana TaxID=7009 RepID=UPI001F4FB219|nr:putative transcription factor SPT20 homolog-like 2 [Schistocerca americana]
MKLAANSFNIAAVRRPAPRRAAEQELAGAAAGAGGAPATPGRDPTLRRSVPNTATRTASGRHRSQQTSALSTAPAARYVCGRKGRKAAPGRAAPRRAAQILKSAEIYCPASLKGRPRVRGAEGGPAAAGPAAPRAAPFVPFQSFPPPLAIMEIGLNVRAALPRLPSEAVVSYRLPSRS